MRESKQARQGAKQLAGCALRPLLALLGDASSEVRAAAAADLGQTLAYVAAAAATAAAAPGSGPGPGPGSGAALGGGGGEWLAALVALEAGAQRDWRLHLSIIQALPSVLRARRRLFLLPAGCMPGVAQAPPSVLCARRCLHCCLLPACGRRALHLIFKSHLSSARRWAAPGTAVLLLLPAGRMAGACQP